MSTQSSQDQSPFWSIERFVAFVLAPFLTAGSVAGTQFATTGQIAEGKPGVGSGIAMGTVALGVAGSIMKWLDGRQYPAVTRAEQFVKMGLAKLAPFANDIRLIPGADGTIERIVSEGEAELDALLNKVKLSGQGADELNQALDEMRSHLETVMHEAITKAMEKLGASEITTTGKSEEPGAELGAGIDQPTGIAQPAAAPPPIPPAADPAPASQAQATDAAAASGAAAGQ